MSLYCEICGKPIYKGGGGKTCSPECSKKLSNINRKKRYRKSSRESKKRVLKHYGNKCQCCGKSLIEFLCIDHISGGGRADEGKNGLNQKGHYYWIIKNNFPSDLQILCYNCNHQKQYDLLKLRYMFPNKEFQEREFCSLHHPELYPEFYEEYLKKYQKQK